jgi:ABC-2 type transport system permease protein
VAGTTVIFRDVEHLLATVLVPWFILTPIFYTFDLVPGLTEHPTVGNVLYYGNPMAPMVEAIRDPIFFGELPALGDVLYSIGAALGSLALGAWTFARLDDRLAASL